MSPSEHHTKFHKNQERKLRQRARRRRCLLKNCNCRFHPKSSVQRYCSEECRKKAKKWRRWKAQCKYRKTPHGKEKRKEQSQRRRERHREAASDAVLNGARVIPIAFFRPLLRPAWLLSKFSQNKALSITAFLFE
jgi:hypothetical protein